MAIINKKAIKSINILMKLYKYNILTGLSSIILILLISSLMFTMGLCYTGNCAYIEERDMLTYEIISPPPPQEYVLANKLINIGMLPLAFAYGILAFLSYKERKKQQQEKKQMVENAKKMMEAFSGVKK